MRQIAKKHMEKCVINIYSQQWMKLGATVVAAAILEYTRLKL